MADYRSKFLNVYSILKSELLEDPAFEWTDASRKWVDRMLDYNVPGGKLNRGLSVIDSYKFLKEGQELTENEIFLACALGWCIEWLQAYFLVLDDIMDNSHTRRGQPCWYRLPKVGMIAVNDGVLLRLLNKKLGLKLLIVAQRSAFTVRTIDIVWLKNLHASTLPISRFTSIRCAAKLQQTYHLMPCFSTAIPELQQIASKISSLQAWYALKKLKPNPFLKL